MPSFDLNGRVALVTGAARGIGYETARQMQMRGASVAVIDLDPEQAREAAERIGERTIGIGADVTDEGAMRSAVAETVERFGGLDVVVANAGIVQARAATVRGIAGEEWERVFEVDMLGVWRTVRAALPQIVERRGHVVLVSSVYAFVNGILNSPYAAAKSGVESLGRSLRSELSPLGSSAGVAYFGWVDTKLVQDATNQETFERLQENTPAFLRRRIEPGEAAAALVRGVEERSPRIFAPRWWRYVSMLRGVINPMLDRGLERDANALEAVRDVEADSDERGAAAVEAARR
ncbi:MAG TPA: short-chain dehydrogenase/reductase [Solirubrobacterales bacterium]|jgi:NAD(P)-dependent dehydrogenase (short-subunit alcohol dehydrogenase family)